MADLKLLTEKVIEKEKVAIRQRVEEARKNAEDEVQAARAKAEQDKIARKQTIDENAQQNYTIRNNTLEIQKRNDVLSAKQAILSRVLEDAKVELDQINEAAFKQFTKDVISQFQSESKVTIVLGSKTVGLIDQAWLESATGSSIEATLSNETVQNEAGLLVQIEGIEYNFLFDALIEDARSEIVPIITKELFV
ncbi:V-type ATP synthase subunit E family protein [Marinilactibacillus sp. Marseille-P9653]|uniref:V-type ATP synthase subunit E family protein n=1 Tax=Marinilactibacillus sp. Marseille-P9653 TaxID=2866583 RepID=UPI001CE3F75B|nr:V-type ATP synthase subunit E family protein [Marinilactibacillus sp. Marseille-P9653]